MDLVIRRVEVVVQVAFFLERCFCRAVIFEFELVVIADIAFEPRVHVIVTTPDTADIKSIVAAGFAECIRASRSLGDDGIDLIFREGVRPTKSRIRHGKGSFRVERSP